MSSVTGQSTASSCSGKLRAEGVGNGGKGFQEKIAPIDLAEGLRCGFKAAQVSLFVQEAFKLFLCVIAVSRIARFSSELYV